MKKDKKEDKDNKVEPLKEENLGAAKVTIGGNIHLNPKEVKLVKDQEGTIKGIEFPEEFTKRDLIRFYLFQFAQEATGAEKTEILRIYKLITEKIKEIETTPRPEGDGYTVKCNGAEGVREEEVKDILENPYVHYMIATIHGEGDKYLKGHNKQVDSVKKLSREERRKLEQLGKKVSSKFKQSAQYVDQSLRYNYPKGKRGQYEIWDMLKDSTKQKIEAKDIERHEIVEGIKLSPSEDKIVDCLTKLLHEKSQNSEPKKEGYYSGNLKGEIMKHGDSHTIAPKLAFTLYELTKEYKGGEYPSGKDIENVKSILQELSKRQFLLSYVEKIPKKDGGRIERKIEDFRELIHIVKLSETDYNKESVELSRKEETIIILNPIFNSQIDSKFIIYPDDINRRTIIAYGSHNLSETVLRLRKYLVRELSSKHYEPEIYQDKLYWLLNEKWMKESRRKKVKEYTDKALETVKALGLLLSYEVTTGATGEPKVTFKLNKDWE
jgi:hypothetical protein